MRRRLATLALVTTLSGCGGAQPPTTPPPETPTSPAVVVTAARWEAAQPLADAGERPFGRCSQFSDSLCRLFYEQTAPVVAANARGQAIALWQRFEGDGFRLVAARFAPGTGWSEAERVTGETNVLSQRVVIDGSGNAVALWARGGSTFTSYGVAAGGWSAPQAVEGTDQLVMDEGGTAHTLFTRSREGLFWSRLAPGAAWSTPVLIQDQGPTSQPFIADARLAVTPGGVAHAVWLRHFQSDVRSEEWDEVWTSQMRPGQGWSTPSSVARVTRASLFDTTLAAADAGALASYQSVEQVVGGRDRWRVLAQHATGSDAWTAPEAVSEPIPAPPAVRNASLPAVAADARGALTLAWSETTYAPSEPQRYEIRARRFSAAAGAWEHAQLVAGARGSLYERFGLQVAASAAGNAVVLWMELDTFGVGFRLWASVFVPGAGWSAPEALRVGERLSAPGLALDGSGNALVMWSEPEGDRTRIWSARLAAVTAPAR